MSFEADQWEDDSDWDSCEGDYESSYSSSYAGSVISDASSSVAAAAPPPSAALVDTPLPGFGPSTGIGVGGAGLLLSAGSAAHSKLSLAEIEEELQRLKQQAGVAGGGGGGDRDDGYAALKRSGGEVAAMPAGSAAARLLAKPPASTSQRPKWRPFAEGDAGGRVGGGGPSEHGGEGTSAVHVRMLNVRVQRSVLDEQLERTVWRMPWGGDQQWTKAREGVYFYGGKKCRLSSTAAANGLQVEIRPRVFVGLADWLDKFGPMEKKRAAALRLLSNPAILNHVRQQMG